MSRQYNGLERRKFARVREEDLLVCEPFDATLFAGVIAKRIRAVTKSIGEGGILFESREAYALGALLELQIDIPGWEKYKAEFYKADKVSRTQPFVVLGKVVRVEEIGTGSFDIGVVFTAVDSGHRDALRKYLENGKK